MGCVNRGLGGFQPRLGSGARAVTWLRPDRRSDHGSGGVSGPAGCPSGGPRSTARRVARARIRWCPLVVLAQHIPPARADSTLRGPAPIRGTLPRTDSSDRLSSRRAPARTAGRPTEDKAQERLLWSALSRSAATIAGQGRRDAVGGRDCLHAGLRGVPLVVSG